MEQDARSQLQQDEAAAKVCVLKTELESSKYFDRYDGPKSIPNVGRAD